MPSCLAAGHYERTPWGLATSDPAYQLSKPDVLDFALARSPVMPTTLKLVPPDFLPRQSDIVQPCSNAMRISPTRLASSLYPIRHAHPTITKMIGVKT